MFEGKNLIGVDIGTSSVKVMQIKSSKKGYFLYKFGIEVLPPQTIVDGHVMNDGVIVDALRKIFKEQRISQKEIALSISGNSVIIKKMNLPLMKQEELEEQIQWEAEQHIPYDISEVELDYNVLWRNEETGQMDVLLVAAKKEEIQDLVDAVRQLKLKPMVVDIDAFALQNVYEYNYGKGGEETIALINIGSAITTVNIIKDGISQFTRDITNGGNVITEEIQKVLQVSYEEAEAYKAGGEEGSTDVVPKEVDEIINSVVDTLAGELQRSLDFYGATSNEDEIERIYITGGTSKNQYLLSAIERRSRISVESLDPFRRVTFDQRQFDPEILKSNAPQATISLGLAMRKQKEQIQ